MCIRDSIKSTSLETPIIERENAGKSLEEAVGGWDRIIVLTAPIGYGKTTFMNQLRKKHLKEVGYVVTFNTFTSIENMVESFKNAFPRWKRLFEGNTDESRFGEYLAKKLGGSRMLAIFDEAQDYPPEVFKWLRILNDHCDNLFMLFIGLPGLDDKIASEASLRDRRAKNMFLESLSTEKLAEILEKRIQWVGGCGIKPFTEDGARRLSDSAQHVPRKLMENGQKVIEYCAKNEIYDIDSRVIENALGSVIDVEIVEKQAPEALRASESVFMPTQSVGGGVIQGGFSFLSELSPTQQEIVGLFKEHESLSIPEISQILEKDIRSVGSLIRKLRGLNPQEVARKPNVPYPVVVKSGKGSRAGRIQDLYSLSDNSRRLLTEN